MFLKNSIAFVTMFLYKLHVTDCIIIFLMPFKQTYLVFIRYNKSLNRAGSANSDDNATDYQSGSLGLCSSKATF